VRPILRRAQPGRDRRGAITVLAALMVVLALVLAAFAIDLGYIMLVGTELQRTADAAAMAATWELIDDDLGSPGLVDEVATARTKAGEFAGYNNVGAAAPTVDSNSANNADGDVVVGYLSDPSDPACQMTFGDVNTYNAVRVRVRKSAAMNGETPFFFARVLGMNSTAIEAEATAALLNNFGGFRAPPTGQTLDILPFALDDDTWNGMLAGGGTDNWRWDSGSKQVLSGSDGIREINLYPQGTGSPGNRGTVDVGGANNSTADIARQILNGVNAEDLSHFPDGELKFDDNGELELNGDTGISAGVKDELASIIGKPRIIPIFNEVHGPGNNAEYTIIEFVGIRVMDVKLTGSMSSKRVMIQPANVKVWGGIPSDGITVQTHNLYSPVWLVR
jgi:Flp pilus assembly protein TadG